ncbi:MAG: hypothetical protein JZU47_11030 [Prolixibacteraceae bacterium]|nr:hypothetical protein [Prolixibacteraceae bacterium]
MIFNKNSNGSEELRVLTGSYYASNEFEKIGVKVELATEDLTTLIGLEVYQVAETHYLSDNYLSPVEPTPEPVEGDSGSLGAGIAPPDYAFRDKLVQYMQLPIAFMATMWHHQGNDLSHEDSGRKNKLDKNSESIAWEWQYNRDDAAALSNYRRAFDRLIRFMNANIDKLPEWKNSPAKKTSLSLFINTAEHFNRLFAIDDSPVFFLRLAPLMREVERKFIKPILGSERFDELKDAIKSGEELSGTDQELYDYVCDPIPLITMSMAVKRFSLTVIPEGVVQNFTSERMTQNANIPATIDLITAVSKSLYQDGIRVLNELKKFWSIENADETDETITEFLPGAKANDKFIAL